MRQEASRRKAAAARRLSAPRRSSTSSSPRRRAGAFSSETGGLPLNKRKHISLALQGGGSHGAFTWGVLHRLIDDPRIHIDGISGASSGAINGVVFADGFLKGRRLGAVRALEHFWESVSQHSPFTHTLMRSVTTPLGRVNLDDTPAFQMIDVMSRLLSPYQLNPFNLNPLRSVLEQQVDFAALRRHPALRLYIAAVNVRRCRTRLFRTPELTTEAVLASACLPMMYQAVQIDGESYWDGGYLGNPALFPLIHECESSDVMVVMVNPLERNNVPETSREILDRITELNFNATLISEMRGVAIINKLLKKGMLNANGYRKINFHLIEPPPELREYSASSRLNVDGDFLHYLHDLGWEAANRWIHDHLDDVGHRSSLDVEKRFMDRH